MERFLRAAITRHERVVFPKKGQMTMDKLKGMAGDFSGIQDQLKDINFPASKDEVLRQLEQKGVPSQVLDKVRNADTSQFDSVDEVMAKIR